MLSKEKLAANLAKYDINPNPEELTELVQTLSGGTGQMTNLARYCYGHVYPLYTEPTPL